jgi:hypothetical protein
MHAATQRQKRRGDFITERPQTHDVHQLRYVTLHALPDCDADIGASLIL